MGNKQESKIYPVEIELSEDFLSKNPTIKDSYENGKLKVRLSSSISKDQATNITDVISDLKSRDLALFNPLLESINTIADLKHTLGSAKPEREEGISDEEYSKEVLKWVKEEDKTYKSITSAIRSFNGATTKSKKEIKAPIIAAGKKVDILYNALKELSDSTRQIVDKNFSELIEEQERIAKEKEAKAKEAELQQIRELEIKNQEATEKIIENQKKANYADLVMEITSYYSGLSEKMAVLNEEGLKMLLLEVQGKTFDLSDIGAMEQASLKSTADALQKTNIQDIKNILDEKYSEGPFPPADEIEEFKNNLEKFPEENPTNPSNDSELFVDIIYHLKNMEVNANRIKTNFEDEKLSKISEQLAKQIAGLKNNIGILIGFTEKKAKIYNSLK